MKDQELHDIFHAYRPEIDDEDAFMDKLTAQMDAIDAQQQTNASRAKQQSRIVPFYRKWMPWAVGVAAAIIIAVVVIKDLSVDSPIREGNNWHEVSLMQPERHPSRMGESSSYFSSTYDEIVNEVEESGRQLEKAIAQL